MLPPGIAPIAPLSATRRGLNVPVAIPDALAAATPMRMPAPTAGQTKHSPTPAATTPTMASVPHGSFLIASHAAPSLLCSALSITWPNSSTDSGRIPVGSAQLIGSFQLYV